MAQAFDKIESFRFTPKEHFTDEDLMGKVVKEVEKGTERSAIQEKFSINPFAVRAIPVVVEDGKINFRNEAELGKAIVRERDKNAQAWALIGARLGGMSEAVVQRLYELTAGKPYTEADIGKGGRPLVNGERAPRKPAAAKAKPAAKKATKKAAANPAAKKAAPAKKATRKRAPKKAAAAPSDTEITFGDEPTAESVGEQLNGKTVTITKGTSELVYEVTEVQAVKQAKSSGRWGAKVTTADGGEKTFPLDSVTAIA